MEIALAPEIEARIHEIALTTERTVDEVVNEMIQSQLEHDAWFRAEVQKGRDAIDRGEWLDHKEVARQMDYILEKNTPK
jgi:predicted transcriptional regulator